jgi:hypothetical protein
VNKCPVRVVVLDGQTIIMITGVCVLCGGGRVWVSIPGCPLDDRGACKVNSSAVCNYGKGYLLLREAREEPSLGDFTRGKRLQLAAGDDRENVWFPGDCCSPGEMLLATAGVVCDGSGWLALTARVMVRVFGRPRTLQQR